MAITGNLDTMELAELLQWLSQGQKTGTLVIDNRRLEKRIFFHGGKIISSASSDPKEYLGHFLVAHGLISERQLAEAAKRQEKEKTLLGKILVEMGALSADKLDFMLRLKAEESIFALFTWDEGEFRFLDDDLPSYEMVPISLDVTGLIMEAVRRVDEWNRIKGTISSSTAIPVIIADDVADDPALDEGARRILAAVNDDRTIEEIALETHSSEFFVSETVFRQVQARRIKVVRPRGTSGFDQEPAALDAQTLVDRALEHFRLQEYDLALRHLNAARTLEPNDETIRKHVGQVETVIDQTLERDGVVPSAVPHLAVDFEDLTALDVSPKEGFLLSRMNGTYDLAAILKISPMAPLEVRFEVWKLVRAGYVELEERAPG